MNWLSIHYILPMIAIGVTASHNPTSSTIIPTTRSSGLYYENIGEVLLSNDHWSFFTYENYTQYLQALWFVEQEVARVQSICDVLGKNTSCHQGATEIVQRLDSIMETDTALANSLGIRKPRRVKRFWGFSGMKILTGVLDNLNGEDNHIELQKTQQGINDLISSQEVMRNDFNTKMTAFTVGLQRQNEVQEDMQNDIISIKDSTNKLQKQLDEIETRISENEINIYYVKTSLNLLEVHQNILFLLEKFERDQGKLYESVKKAKRGEMDDEILTPAGLIELMRNVMGHLPEGQIFPFHPEMENGKYIIRTIKTDLRLYNGLIMFIMYTPLVHFKKYRIHKVTSLPVETKEDGKFAFLLPKHSFLIVDAKDSEYTTMSSDDFKGSCKIVKNTEYLCKQTNWLSLANVATECAPKMFFEANSIPESCDKRVMQLTKPLYLQLMMPDNWIYVIPKSTDLMLICGQNSRQVTLQGTGVIAVPRDCSISMNHEQLQCVKEFTANVSGVFIPTKANLFVDLSKHDTVPVDHSTVVILPFELKELRDISAGVSNAIATRKQIVITSTFSTITLLALILLVIILYRKRVMYCVRRKLGYADEDRLNLKVKVNNRDEKLCRVSVMEKPSENDPGADYVTVRFKVKKENKKEGPNESEKPIPADEPRIDLLRKLKPANGPNAEFRMLKPNTYS